MEHHSEGISLLDVNKRPTQKILFRNEHSSLFVLSGSEYEEKFNMSDTSCFFFLIPFSNKFIKLIKSIFGQMIDKSEEGKLEDVFFLHTHTHR